MSHTVLDFRNSIIVKIVFMILLMVLPLSVMLVFVTRNSMKIVEDQAITFNKNVLNVYMIQLDKDMYSIERYLYGTEQNTYFMQMIRNREENEYTLARFNLNREYSSEMAVNTRLSALFYYKQGQEILLNLKTAFRPIKEEMEKFLKEETVKQGTKRWYLIEIEGQKFLLDIVRQQGAYIGGIISVEEILRELKGAFDYKEMEFYLEDKQKEAGKDQVGVYAGSTLNGLDLTLNMLISRREVIENLPLLQKVNYNLALLLLFVTPMILFILRNILLKPLMRINFAMDMIKKEEVRYRIPEYHTSREFEKINATFNSMMDTIMHLKIDNYERELENQKIEVQNLHLQLRPHFLLNSFNLIYHLAGMRDFEGIQKMILCLTSYYRESISADKEFRTVWAERNFIRNYLEIAGLRYRNCFRYEEEIEEEVKEALIPALLLQTFVENSISHGLKLGSLITIQVKIFRENENLVLLVSDNGNGIPAEILEEIQKGGVVVKEGEEHIGLWNCRKRLERLYGDRAEFRLTSQKQEGTAVKVTIPYNTNPAAGKGGKEKI